MCVCVCVSVCMCECVRALVYVSVYLSVRARHNTFLLSSTSVKPSRRVSNMQCVWTFHRMFI